MKWLSRKLLVAIVAVVAIAWGIHTGDEAVEGKIIAAGDTIATAAIALISAVYMIIQGLIDKKKEEK